MILDEEGGVVGSLAIVDYKTAADPKSDDVFAFQLAIYTAAGRGEGINVQAAYLHHLAAGQRSPVTVDDPTTTRARSRATTLIGGLTRGEFDPKPEKSKCQRCDVRAVCRHAQCSTYEL